MQSISDYFSADGPLAEQLPGFRPRPEQLRMAEAVAAAIAEREVLIAEAGTGTGKTFAYLVPALLSGRKVIVSTGTKTLQDQLFQKDAPLVRQALDRPVRIALLKGRANYLCLQRLETTVLDGRFDSREQTDRFQRIRQWAGVTRSGDLAEVSALVSDPLVRSRVSSTAENCLGGECPFYGECFLMEARRAAQEADVVVVNHHLLMADWALKEGKFGEVLPSADVYILDEAHQLPEVAAQFFGIGLSSRQLSELVRDAKHAYFEEAGDMPQLVEAADELSRAVLDFRAGLGQDSRRGAWLAIAENPAVENAVDNLNRRLRHLGQVLEPLAERGKELESCARRVQMHMDSLQSFVAPEEDHGRVQWYETYAQGWALKLTPLDVAPQFRSHMSRLPAAWIFTSATLSVGGAFEHFASQIGLEEPRTLRVDSPFDYARNALLYLPRGLPYPGSERFDDAFLKSVLPVLEASGGRAFLLFTSHRALRFAADWLRIRLRHPLLVQGEAAQAQLLERFRELGNAVLLGTASFWEGVDVRGDALSVVAIDRLPFASPSDPVMQARIEALNRASGNAFMEHQLPLAVIALRQGAGRLIRDAADRGVLMIGDNRLLSKAYGKVFLKSLPPMPVTHEIGDVQAFFAQRQVTEGLHDASA